MSQLWGDILWNFSVSFSPLSRDVMTQIGVRQTLKNAKLASKPVITVFATKNQILNSFASEVNE